ncbi:hypothetical protein P691DRAFT_25791 [Macrolepiota fuliginosa MF-IS2]|uniref:Uncharacterized protein n=1 Tax=Macrolepiota fuliginosa MF-IS2 TaxID=1400762 RepID=A0A9P6C6H1_9AGAR|nr:hypothetical protein P691DRAFT_25791 [Macrolepiota fuliginosa MF-IS2]
MTLPNSAAFRSTNGDPTPGIEPALPASTNTPGHNPIKLRKNKKKNKRKNKSVTQSANTIKPFPHFSDFPDKVQKWIFECAYYWNHVSGAVLALVSRKANEWIEPLIYHHIVIDRFHRISYRPDRLWRTFSEGTKPKEFYKNQVKSLLVNGNVDAVVTDLLSTCTDISSFACYAQGALPETILEKLSTIFTTQEFPNLRRLSLSGLGIDASDIKRPFFRNLTHLAVDIGNDHQSFPWQELEIHPHLTHILIDTEFDLHQEAPQIFKSMILDILSHSPPTLYCLVVLVDWDKLYESSFQLKCDRAIFSEVIDGKLDGRVVVAAYTGDQEEIDVTVVGEHPVQFLEYVGHVALTPGHTVPWVCTHDDVERDVWERAEEVLRQRQKL